MTTSCDALLQSSNPLIVHYSNHYRIITTFLYPEFPIFIFNHILHFQINFERTVSNNCQLFTPFLYTQHWSFIVPILLSSSQSKKKIVKLGRSKQPVPFPFERLTKERASFKFFTTNSRCIWIPTVVPSNLHLFAGLPGTATQNFQFRN